MYHKGLYILNQTLEKKQSEAFYYIRKLHLQAPEEFWDWQGKKKGVIEQFLKVFRKIVD